GGLIASLIDCHGTGSAALAVYRSEERNPGTEPALRFVTASLQVDYLKPTPLGIELLLKEQ
ncbi:MAG: PaaI family thioesterase, partial [Ignavibacteriaceae bacterium]|nr:PaaI family thioesterase [Ignavibacteriaceae bacterium]